MMDEKTRIEDLEREVKLLREYVELKERIIDLEKREHRQPIYIPYPSPYPSPYPYDQVIYSDGTGDPLPYKRSMMIC